MVYELSKNNFQVPSEHMLKKHKLNCLQKFVVNLSKPLKNLKRSDTKNSKILKVDDEDNILDMMHLLENYRCMDDLAKSEDKIKRLQEIGFLSSIIIHH